MTVRPTFVAIILACAAALLAVDAAAARTKKARPVRPDPSSYVERDYDGTPIIMRGFRRTRPAEEPSAPQAGSGPVYIPRGSSTYIPPPVPSPYASPPPPLTQPPGVYQPPPITTFSDRVIDAIHAYPLEKGIGNNPTDQQMFIRQRVNQ